MDRICIDVEIEKTIDETPGGWDATHLLGAAVTCIWEERGNRMRVYGPNDLVTVRERIRDADRVDGFNIWNFDFPVIWGVSKTGWRVQDTAVVSELKKELLPKTNDILRRIWISLGLDPDTFDYTTHGGFSLDAVAGATINSKKIGHGASAPVWYQEGKIQRVANYCADDVAIERDLADFIDRYGYVINPKTGKKLEIVDRG